MSLLFWLICYSKFRNIGKLFSPFWLYATPKIKKKIIKTFSVDLQIFPLKLFFYAQCYQADYIFPTLQQPEYH